MRGYLGTIFDALYFSVAIASVPIGLILVAFNVSDTCPFVMAFPLCWVKIHA